MGHLLARKLICKSLPDFDSMNFEEYIYRSFSVVSISWVLFSQQLKNKG